MTIGRKDNDMNDNDSETSEHNDYSGFQLIPELDMGDSDSSDDESSINNNNNQNGGTRKLTREEEIKRQVELNNKFLFDDDVDDANTQQQDNFTDFQGYSDQFHQFDQTEDDGGSSDLKVNPNNLLFNTNELFPTENNNPFNDEQPQQQEEEKNTSPYCQRNEKGHLVLSKDKLLPPDHVDLIRECMKNIKVAPPPELSEKWKSWDNKLQSKFNK
ncbi:hypothetical protein DFA_11514 [Cavenderia fasciculata]|uniref:Uncharacterized protein n=1 Tax=Cavenderia fasciculata TaxID=261658 RepID=F4QDC5_CACFS|nr:uncharacterized protein DFA_11514 [Cavenderia fasciculata]EGG13753.1 hypothetical protein DFA_11514 [Cavenderia fasciculata]|eukprot:XP_004350461.1 hypothetical protein DFA_11514 [Cavenderia fasciculata]